MGSIWHIGVAVPGLQKGRKELVVFSLGSPFEIKGETMTDAGSYADIRDMHMLRPLDREPREVAPIVRLLEGQHENIERLDTEADEAAGAWCANPILESGEALADVLDQLIHALREHVRPEEQRILSLIPGRTHPDESLFLPGLLTEAERRVLRYLPTHLSAPEIAAELSCSVNTVRTHQRHVYAKLGASSRTEAVMRASALGMLAPTQSPETQEIADAIANPPYLFDSGPVNGRKIVDDVQSPDGEVPGAAKETLVDPDVTIFQPAASDRPLPAVLCIHGAGRVSDNDQIGTACRWERADDGYRCRPIAGRGAACEARHG
jgi:DNA-binding CsgD family transcriptional regulator